MARWMNDNFKVVCFTELKIDPRRCARLQGYGSLGLHGVDEDRCGGALRSPRRPCLRHPAPYLIHHGMIHRGCYNGYLLAVGRR